MARKPAITVEKLTELGPEKLAQMVLDQSERDAPFRKQVSAALAAKKGPDSVAKIVDRRLAALEKARSFIDWDKTYAFRDDLSATVAVAAEDLGRAAPAMAVDRLLRFIATHESVFERVDDSSGYIQEIYYDAIDKVGELTSSLTLDEKADLPGKIMNALGDTSHGYLVDVAKAAIEKLPNEILREWEAVLARLQTRQEAQDAKSKDDFVFSNAGQYRDIRQSIAGAIGDLDGLIALEEKKHPNLQDTLGVAERLFEAGRTEEALKWVRRDQRGGLKYMTAADMADGVAPHDAFSFGRTNLEAEILDALGNAEQAQSLRWSAFEKTLSTDMLRNYVSALPDFEEFDVLDRAFSSVSSSSQIYGALAFFMEWPKLDLAAKKVLAHKDEWNGRQYHILPMVADALQHEHALAATILYRALLDDILARARSKAYAHAVRYLTKLDELAPASDAEASDIDGFTKHTNYRLGLQKKHGRKASFWAQVK